MAPAEQEKPSPVPPEKVTRHLTPGSVVRSHQAVLMSHDAVLDEEAQTVLRMLADPLRARIVGLLATEQLCTCHLVELTGASQTNLSNHLRGLREAGIVAAEPVGRYTYYRLLPARLETVAAALTGLADRARTGQRQKRPCR